MNSRTLPPGAYEKLTGAVARDTGDRRSAALWVHAAGLDGLRKSLETLASCHPALAALTDPDVLPVWSQPLGEGAWEAVNVLWDGHPDLEDEHRIDGYALGDTHQLLSDDARKGRALCQTPPWIARLLLRLSLEPAMQE